MYRKYILDNFEDQQPQNTSAFPDTHLIVGDAQSKAARAGAAQWRETGPHLSESSAYKSDRSDSGIDSEFGSSYGKGSASQEVQNNQVELKIRREWGSYKKSSKAKTESEFTKGKLTKQKSASGVQSEISKARSEPQSPFSSLKGKSKVTSLGNEPESTKHPPGPKFEVGQPRRTRYSHADIDLFDEFGLNDHVPEFRRRPKSVAVTDLSQGGIQRTTLTPTNESAASNRSSPLTLWDAHGCRNLNQEVIVAKPIAEAAQGKPRSALSFQRTGSDGVTKVFVEADHSLHNHTSHLYSHNNDVIRVLPAPDRSLTSSGKMVINNNESVDSWGPQIQSPRYSKLLHGENAWKQLEVPPNLRPPEKRQTLETPPGSSGSTPSLGTGGFYSTLCCNKKNSVSKT